jgi:hypothetical protein
LLGSVTVLSWIIHRVVEAWNPRQSGVEQLIEQLSTALKMKNFFWKKISSHLHCEKLWAIWCGEIAGLSAQGLDSSCRGKRNTLHFWGEVRNTGQR